VFPGGKKDFHVKSEICSLKWKGVALQEKISIIQKLKENLNTCSNVYVIFIQFLGGTL
jgi:hypothetical protein